MKFTTCPKCRFYEDRKTKDGVERCGECKTEVSEPDHFLPMFRYTDA